MYCLRVDCFSDRVDNRRSVIILIILIIEYIFKHLKQINIKFHHYLRRCIL